MVKKLKELYELRIVLVPYPKTNGGYTYKSEEMTGEQAWNLAIDRIDDIIVLLNGVKTEEATLLANRLEQIYDDCGMF